MAVRVFRSLHVAPVVVFGADLLTFTEWKSYTNPETGQSGWISDGGQVRYDDPRHGDDAKSGAESALKEVAAENPVEAADPEVWKRAETVAGRVAQAAYGWAIRRTWDFYKIGDVLGAVFDTPDDLKKFGYNPTMSSGTHHAGIADPMKENLGVSTHLVATIASKVLAKAYEYGKARLAKGRTTRTSATAAEQYAEELSQLFAMVNQSLGLTGPVPDAARVLAGLGQGKPSVRSMADRTAPVSELFTDPRRFQWRKGYDAAGTVRQLPRERFDPKKAGPLLVWRDPNDRRLYVVDGHHRLAWARRDGFSRVAIKEVVTPTAAAAREIGRSHNERFSDNPTGPTAGAEAYAAGPDAAAATRLVRAAVADGSKLLADVTREALRNYPGSGPLLSPEDVSRLAESYAAVNTYANLLGRSRVREMSERVTGLGELARFAESGGILSRFADAPDVLRTPEEALDYFTSLVPSLGLDPVRFLGDQRRWAFTLAASTNDVLTRRVQQLIASGLQSSRSVADTTAGIRAALDAAGVSPRNPQYAEMVYRTNAMDAFTTGVYEEGRTPDVAESFPVWEYMGIIDNRTGADHRPKIGRYYPAGATFADVRGDRPYNCRCGMRWVDKFEWDELRAKGVRLESRW